MLDLVEESLRQDGLMLARKDLGWVPALGAIDDYPGVKSVLEQVIYRVLGEAAIGAGAKSGVVEPVGDVLVGEFAGRVALKHLAHGFGFLGNDDRRRVRIGF